MAAPADADAPPKDTPADADKPTGGEMAYGAGWDEAKCAEARKSGTKPAAKDCPTPKREKRSAAPSRPNPKAVGRPLN